MTSVISDHYYQLSADLVVSPAALLLVLDGVHVLNNHAAVLGGHPVIAENINLFTTLSIIQIYPNPLSVF